MKLSSRSLRICALPRTHVSTLIALLVALCASTPSYGQTLSEPQLPIDKPTPAFAKGSLVISGGYGALTLTGLFVRLMEDAINADGQTNFHIKSQQLGPVYAKVEYGVAEHIGIGLNAAFLHNRWSTNYQDYDPLGNPAVYNAALERTAVSALARVNFHIGSDAQFDPYVGMGLGGRYTRLTYTDTNPYGQQVDFPFFFPVGGEITAGLRYYPVPFVGLYAEAGFAKSFVQGGLVINIPTGSIANGPGGLR